MPNQPLQRSARARAADLLRRFLRGKVGARRLIGSSIRYLILEGLGVHVISAGGPAAIVFSHKKLYPHIDRLVGQIQSLQADRARLQSHIGQLVAQIRRITEQATRLQAIEKHADHLRADRDAVAAERDVVRAALSALESRVDVVSADRDAVVIERDVAQAALATLEMRLRDEMATALLRLDSTRRELEASLGSEASSTEDAPPDAGKELDVDLLSALALSSRGLEATAKAVGHRYSDLIGSSRGLMEALERHIFEARTPQAGAQAASSGMLAGGSADEILRSFIVNSEPLNGSRHFRAVAPAFAPRRAIDGSFHDDLLPRLGKFHIVDIGSEMLSYEDDIYAPLARQWPCNVVGFDPFSSSTAGNGVDVARPDGRQVRTIATLVGDGEPVDFRINQSGPTSSILMGNQPLTLQFGLLGASLKTVEIRRLPTRRLDDLLQEGLLFDGEIDFIKVDVQGAAHEVLTHGLETLGRSLVVHVEVELAEVYLKERLFGDVDRLMREAGFDLVDFYSLGRMRYSSLNASDARFFHAGRLLWVDAVYLSGLDEAGKLSGEKLLRAAVMMHEIYNKQDLAAELFARYDRESGENMTARYLEICSLKPRVDSRGRPADPPRQEDVRG